MSDLIARIEPSPLPVEPLLSDDGHVVSDLPCRRCAYNVRGLSIDGRCPECGTPVGLSVKGDLLRFSDPAWLRKLARGMVMMIVAVPVLIFASMLGSIEWTTFWVFFTYMLTCLAGTVINAIGGWWATDPDPSGIGEDRYGVSRQIIRIAMVVSVISMLMFAPPRAVIPRQTREMLNFIMHGLRIIMLIGVFAQFRYLGKLATRLPNPFLTGFSRLLMWTLGTSYAMFAMCRIFIHIGRLNGVGIPLVELIARIDVLLIGALSIISAVLFMLLRNAFADAAGIAEHSWARA